MGRSYGIMPRFEKQDIMTDSGRSSIITPMFRLNVTLSIGWRFHLSYLVNALLLLGWAEMNNPYQVTGWAFPSVVLMCKVIHPPSVWSMRSVHQVSNAIAPLTSRKGLSNHWQGCLDIVASNYG